MNTCLLTPLSLARAVLPGLLLLAGLPALAQIMKPGLWEASNKLGGSPEMDQAMAQMQQQMASMPPAQRKQMEDMMAKQGMSPGGASKGGMVTKMCITPEMADKQQLPIQQQGTCTTTSSDKSSTGMKLKFSCTNPPSSGEGQVTFTGDTAYTMSMKINTGGQGVPKSTTLHTSAKWLDSNCGAIKPMVVPKQ
ncbi:DUF3617 domain-containing protein [Polaromonas sp. SM01]|uniref:DUF3617 domain-containing protein n=1 Tax=Polaromonas sp. SM01 TaxID=3085630 RepID=UPI00298273B0|nr:DUF3617 domain-containing protein [Polaromonas sp. SM01]MDW5442563.1 DUF3617 domain-containing protein [Polaromonas sp. SM01]